MRGAVFPELVAGRDDGFAVEAWTIEPGSTQRGGASCNLSERVLEVPLGADPTSRVVRAHELMHARVSPFFFGDLESLAEFDPRALECAEELRVNTLVARLGFDVALLRDGTEKDGGRRLGESGEWSEALCFLMAVLGTGAERPYLAGIRTTSPTWMAGLRAMRKRALGLMDDLDTAALGSTRVNAQGVASGYADATLVLARVLTQTMMARPPVGSDELRRFRRSLEPGGRRPATGRFATLVLDESLAMRARPRETGLRRARPCSTGTTMRYPSRLLTDDQKRAFARRTAVHGGIVVIDQSGSMDVDDAQMRALLERAPDALVVGYSHRPGDRSGTVNAWVLANRGRVARECPSGNVGNGVDGPVLAWALAQRRGAEPIVWITDGQVTDSNDHPDETLTAHCAQLVVRHRIRLVRDLEGAARSLAVNRAPSRAQLSQFGRVGRRILENG